MAITFDDGPHPEGTPAVLELLARAGARATFFVIGEQVQLRPALAARDRRPRATRSRCTATGTGCSCGCSAARRRATTSRAARPRSRTRPASTPVCHRPPYGIYSPAGLDAAPRRGAAAAAVVALGQGLAQVHDAASGSPRAPLGELAPGDVILLHDADFYSSQRLARADGRGAYRLILSRAAARGNSVPSYPSDRLVAARTT